MGAAYFRRGGRVGGAIPRLERTLRAGNKNDKAPITPITRTSRQEKKLGQGLPYQTAGRAGEGRPAASERSLPTERRLAVNIDHSKCRRAGRRTSSPFDAGPGGDRGSARAVGTRRTTQGCRLTGPRRHGSSRLRKRYGGGPPAAPARRCFRLASAGLPRFLLGRSAREVRPPAA